MGLIKAGTGSAGGVLADQWKEFFYCEALDTDVLVAKGVKQVSGRSSNTKASDNIISNGSRIAVADGQCMLIVDQGKVVEVCAEPGEFTYDTSTEPSVFYGGLGAGIKDSFKKLAERFGFGGDTGHDQRIYYVNTKEIVGNKYGTPTPVPFRVVDANIGLDVDISVRCNGEYSYKVVDPLLFYTNVCGNVEQEYRRGQIDSQLKSELLTALQPAFAKISEAGVRYSAVPAHTAEVRDALDAELSAQWTELRGIKIVSFGVNSIAASEEDQQLIKDLQKSAVLRDPNMGAATLTAAQADALRGAAVNENGAMAGLMGMGMVGNMAGNQATNLYAMGQQDAAQQPAAQAQGAVPAATVSAATWVCPTCGSANTAKFCHECGSARPEQASGWTCACGTLNKGKFCGECGAPKPAAAPLYRCDKCGWEPDDPTKPPKFCPECGDPFDEGDIKR